MDYGQTAPELVHLERLRRLVKAHGDDQHLSRISAAGHLSPELDAGILTPELIAAPLHERLLVVEEAARLGLAVVPGPALLVGADVIDTQLSAPVAVINRDRPGPSRIPSGATLAIVLHGPDGWVIDLIGCEVTPVESSFGYSFAEVHAERGVTLAPEKVALTRRRRHLMLAAVIAGTASGALAQIAHHLRTREQFGRRLATFQALRHRIAELAVSTEATLWLAREAAWHDDSCRAGIAVSYARDLAAAMTPEVVQLCGARGFTLEHPAHLFAMRLEGLRLETGSADRLAKELSSLRLAPSEGFEVPAFGSRCESR